MKSPGSDPAPRADRVFCVVGVVLRDKTVARKWTTCFAFDRAEADMFRAAMEREYVELGERWDVFLKNNPRPRPKYGADVGGGYVGPHQTNQADRAAFRTRVEAWGEAAKAAVASRLADMMDSAVEWSPDEYGHGLDRGKISYHVEVVLNDPTARCTCPSTAKERVHRETLATDPACQYHGEGTRA